jgi:hypothetical protein
MMDKHESANLRQSTHIKIESFAPISEISGLFYIEGDLLLRKGYSAQGDISKSVFICAIRG